MHPSFDDSWRVPPNDINEWLTNYPKKWQTFQNKVNLKWYALWRRNMNMLQLFIAKLLTQNWHFYKREKNGGKSFENNVCKFTEVRVKLSNNEGSVKMNSSKTRLNFHKKHTPFTTINKTMAKKKKLNSVWLARKFTYSTSQIDENAPGTSKPREIY